MTKYLINRILRSLVSVVIVVAVVMLMIYSGLDRNLIFANDPVFSHTRHNQKEIYMMQQWEKYGYVDYVPYADWLQDKLRSGKITQEVFDASVKIGNTPGKDSEGAAEYIALFEKEMGERGYTVTRLDAVMKAGTRKYQDGGQPQLFAHKDLPLTNRLWNYFTGIIEVDNIHNAKGDVGQRKIWLELYDPVYGGEKFSPAIMGNGTTHRYLFYMDDNFPFIHQNLVTINLGESYSVNKGIDVFHTMTASQGARNMTMVTYPSGNVEESADNLHSLTYVEGSLEKGDIIVKRNYVDDYTNVTPNKLGLSKMGYSFAIGIISVILSYLLGIPLGITMALKKDKLVDKLGTIYIIFVIAVPSLAYIFLFKTMGGAIGLPTTFDMEHPTWQMYVLPIISLALPSVASLMKWLRRYMIDQMNADYVKFARSGGLSEGEIFTKHVLKNAIIPIVHGIPGSVLGAMTGAIITERVYVVPGAGNMLTEAINTYDNGVIVGMTLFYALLTVTSIILGDVLMSLMDPRISFTAKER